MRKKLICLMLVITILMTGCFSYKDINRILFVTGILIDLDEKNNIVLYSEAFVSTRSSGDRMGNEERIIFKSNGETFMKAAGGINLRSTFRLNYTQNKAIIFTERAAKYGLDNFIDGLYRDQQTLLRQYLFIYPGEPEKFMNVELKEEPFIGIFLADLIQNQKVTSVAMRRRLDEYLNNRLMGSTVDAINIIDIDKSQLNERIFVNGAAVIKDDKMVGRLDNEESYLYNLLKKTVKLGTIILPNPEHKDKFITLRILNSKTKDSLDYDGSKVILKKNIVIRTSFGETQKSIHILNDEEREAIIKDAEDKVKNQCIKLFNDYKEKGIDLLDVQNKFDRKYPNTNIKDVINIVELNLSVKVYMEGSTDTTDFK
jgi:spore germination protein KC